MKQTLYEYTNGGWKPAVTDVTGIGLAIDAVIVVMGLLHIPYNSIVIQSPTTSGWIINVRNNEEIVKTFNLPIN